MWLYPFPHVKIKYRRHWISRMSRLLKGVVEHPLRLVEYTVPAEALEIYISIAIATVPEILTSAFAVTMNLICEC